MPPRQLRDIYADILEVAMTSNRSPTYVLLNAGVSGRNAKKYLSEMEQQGLISFEKGHGRAKKFVRVTPKGEELLRQYDMGNNGNIVGSNDKN